MPGVLAAASSKPLKQSVLILFCINNLPFHVFSASHESRLTVSKPGRSEKCALGARNFSEQCAVQTTLSPRSVFRQQGVCVCDCCIIPPTSRKRLGCLCRLAHEATPHPSALFATIWTPKHWRKFPCNSGGLTIKTTVSRRR